MQYKGKEISQELLRKAEECENAQELMKLAEENGIELSIEEAEAFLDENADIELDAEMLDQAAGGKSGHGKKLGCDERTKFGSYD